MIQIGPYSIKGRAILAPMAGVTDAPFRELCERQGAAMTVSEMVTSDTRLWNSRKSRLRLQRAENLTPHSVQIAGSEPAMMAEAARQNVALGAQIIDINMGCPAKKVCRRAAGSALLKDLKLVADILQAVTTAVSVPVTLKIRTGWDTGNRNGVTVAQIAEHAGIAALAVHGRTRACRFKGPVEYDTIAGIVDAVKIPVFANGDIGSAEQAREVLDYTGADAVMIGRGAQGNPWIFGAINRYLATGDNIAAPAGEEIIVTIQKHIAAIHTFYGTFLGVRLARKHIGWYFDRLAVDGAAREFLNQIEDPKQQLDYLHVSLQSTTCLQAKAA